MIKNRRAFIVGIKSSTLSNKEIYFLKKYKPWGVILFSRNISSIEQTKKLTDRIKKIFNIEPSDQRAVRLRNRATEANSINQFNSVLAILVLIIGLMDFLAVVTAATSDKDWLGRHLEGYIFVAMVLWVMLYTMSRYSKKLELRFNTENKN